MKQSVMRPFGVALRILGTVMGGYGLSSLWVALLASLLVGLGQSRAEAVVSASMGGFLIYLCLLVYGFSTVTVRTLWVVLAGVLAASYGLLLLAV